MTLYLSGPITAETEQEEETNTLLFSTEALHLRELGYLVINPAALGRLGGWREYMGRDISLLLAHADHVAMLPGWFRSRGALLEATNALVVGQGLYDAATIPPAEDFGQAIPLRETLVDVVTALAVAMAEGRRASA